jgi:hypothetical protein
MMYPYYCTVTITGDRIDTYETDDDAYYSGDKDYDWEYKKTSANALVALTIAAANIAHFFLF